jgi:phosphatidylserine/phosphatidylglycerophosphate/cardiolipin synthase-like enzyme
LLQQPNDGVAPLVHAIDAAKTSIEILIFRFDQSEIERALANAVSRGVSVQALIAHVNSSGEDSLRRLEMRLLAEGLIVARTDGGLTRYHGKMMIVDHRELYVLAFNLTHQDLNASRSFGIVTKDPKLVREAMKLFAADTRRQPYEAGLGAFVVSPANARKQLSAFIKGAKNELLIYDPKISDPTMVRLLEDRNKAEVDVRIIGQMSGKKLGPSARKLPQLRLHTRTMIRDRRLAFVGSQSLREIELDERREIGIVFRDPTVVNQLAQTFQEDWDLATPAMDLNRIEVPPLAKVAKKVAKAVSKELPPVAPVLEVTIKEIVGDNAELALDNEEVEEAVRDAVKEAVKEAVRDVVEEATHAAVVKGRSDA